MFNWYRRWRRARVLREHPVPSDDFSRVLRHAPACSGLTGEERDRLRELVSLFLHEKVFEAVGDVGLDADDRLLVAINACLPVLGLGIEMYDDWATVIVYPEPFLVDVEEQDEAGVVHSGRDLRAGEAWERGPLVISLRDVHAGAEAAAEGYNVVIHECAHQLDLLSGETNGCPPLHSGMSVADWSEAFSQAYADLGAYSDRGEEAPLDIYAVQSPAECFAVFSEYFFESPQALVEVYPAVYDQMARFYRQDPAARH